MSIPGLRWAFKHPRVCVAAAIFTVVLALIIGSRLVTGRKTHLPPVIVLPSNFTIPPQRAPIPERWIPLSWGWLWRLKDRVLGKAKELTMDVAAGELDSVVFGTQADPELRGMLSHPDFADTSGLRVWLLPNSRIRELQNRFSGSAVSHYFFRCGITTADKCEATLTTTGLGTGGHEADVLPLFHGSTVDLTFIFKSVAPVAAPTELSMAAPPQTNVPIAVRLQLPAGTGFFVLNSQSRSTDGEEAAVLVTVEPPNSNPAGIRPAAIVKRAN